MHISIYSLKKTLFDGEAISLTCQTQTGEITILEHHRPLITLLTKGTLRVRDRDNQEHFIPVISGVLEVQSESKVRCVVE